MNDVLNRIERHRDHCLVLAETTNDGRTRASLLRIARLFEVEVRLIVSAKSDLSESRDLLERASAVLSQQSAAPLNPLTVRPCPTTDGRDRDR
jgi:hypothetical protein